MLTTEEQVYQAAREEYAALGRVLKKRISEFGQKLKDGHFKYPPLDPESDGRQIYRLAVEEYAEWGEFVA